VLKKNSITKIRTQKDHIS